MRPPISAEDVDDLFQLLGKKDVREPTNWSRRFKNHQEKLKSGDVYQVAEVVRNLALREATKGLSAGEKAMLVKARSVLVSELSFALNLSEDDALEEARRATHLSRRADERRPRHESAATSSGSSTRDDRNLAARQSIYSYQRPQRRPVRRLARPRRAARRRDGARRSAAATACISPRCTRAVIGASCAAPTSRTGCCAAPGPRLATVRCSSATRRRCRSPTSVRRRARDAHAVPRAGSRAGRSPRLRRVLRPGGVALVLTNSERALPGARRAARRMRADGDRYRRGSRPRVARPVHDGERRRASSSARLLVGGGARLRRASSWSTEVEPVVAYARSMGAFVVDTDGQLDAVLTELERRRRARRSRPTARSACARPSGCFVCR